MAIKIVRTGTWLYGGSAELPVDIVGIDCDYWYEFDEAEGQLEDGQQPMALDENGFLYYGRFQHAGRKEKQTNVDTCGHRSIEEAMRAAQEKVTSPIKWKRQS